MAHEVQSQSYDLKDENKFYRGDLVRILEEDGNYGPQLKWIFVLDEDAEDPYTDEEGNEQVRETWAWCGAKLTLHPNNKFRKWVKGLIGRDPTEGELFHEEHYTKEYYDAHPDADPKELTGETEPWRVGVMFVHDKKADGTEYDKVEMVVSEDRLA